MFKSIWKWLCELGERLDKWGNEFEQCSCKDCNDNDYDLGWDEDGNTKG